MTADQNPLLVIRCTTIDGKVEEINLHALRRGWETGHQLSVEVGSGPRYDWELAILDALVAALSVPNARYDHGGIGSSMESSICGLLDEAYEQALIDVRQAAGVVEGEG